MEEDFKPIEGYSNYHISSLGRVLNTKTKKFVKSFLDGEYVRVKLYKDNKYKNCTVHILVAEYFLNNDFNYKFLKHIDGDVLNNNYLNLIYVAAPKNNILQINKQCTICNEILHINDFVRKNKSSYTSYCRNCDKIQKAKYDQEEYKSTQKEYIKTIQGRTNLMLNKVRQRAKKDSLICTIDEQIIKNALIEGVCQKTNIPFIFSDLDFNPYAPSVDRIDSSKGYTKDNVQVVCMIYNFCKNSFSDDEVFQFFKDIDKFKKLPSIFIPFNTPSSKNSRNFNIKLKRSFASKTVSSYLRASKPYYLDNLEVFESMIKDKIPPYKIQFTFVRKDKRRFDLINAAQIVQDLMVKYEWIEDDDYHNLIPYFGKTSVDKENPGVYISIL